MNSEQVSLESSAEAGERLCSPDINKTVDDAYGFNACVKSFGRVLNHGSLIAGRTKPLKPTSVISYSSSVELDVVFRTVRLNIDELGTLL